MQIRPFKSIVESKHDREPAGEPSDKLLTPANVITAARIPLVLKAAQMLIKGDRPVSPLVAGLLVMDAVDGTTARLFDKFFPDLKIGRSKIGEPEDQWVDLAVGTILSRAILKAPQVPAASKLAAAVVMGQEGYKTAWAVHKGVNHYLKTGEVPVVKTADIGREAMIEKGFSLATAVISGDVQQPVARQALGATSLFFATLGATHGEQARQDYAETMLAQLETFQAEQGMQVELMFDGYPTLAES